MNKEPKEEDMWEGVERIKLPEAEPIKSGWIENLKKN